MIQIKNVSKLYPAKAAGNENASGKESQNGAIHALDHISLHVAQGEWLSIMGPSGSGKSTLVNLIGCLDRPTSGEIWLDGQNVAGISAAELNRVEQLGMIAVNIRALTDLSLRFADQLIRNRGGILNLGSIAGFLPGPGMAVYYASKAYVLSFTEALLADSFRMT